jgi:transcriptional regulator with XRE-family HTH domain
VEADVQDLAALVGQRVKARREARALTWAELARRSGASVYQVRSLEEGQWPIEGYIMILQRVADTLGAAPGDLDEAWLYMHTTPVQRLDEPVYDMRTTKVRRLACRTKQAMHDATGTATKGVAG